MPPEDEVFPAKEQPLPVAVSPTADSPGYIADSDLEEDEEDLEEDPKEDPIDYLADKGDDDDNDDESSDADEDDDDDVKEEEDEEEEEHSAPADSISRLLDIPSPPLSPLSPWSSPLPQIPSPPLPVSSLVPISPLPLPTSPTYPLGYRAAMIRMRVETPSTSYLLPSSTPPLGTPPLLPIPLPTPSPPMLLPSTLCRAGVFEVTLPPRKRLCIALSSRYEVSESSSTPTARPTGGFRANYGFVATLDDEIRCNPKRHVGYGITDTWDEMLVGMPGDTDEIYGRLDDVQDDRSLMSGRLNMLFRDRRVHARTALLIERERKARLSCEAWGRSMDASDIARFEVRALRTTVLAQQTDIAALRAVDHTRQAQLVETLRLMSTLQIQVTALQEQQGLARGPAQPEILEEAGSSS
ncbi:hypothetical protein Tco_1509400 [Tanacetum coccineum]